MIWHTQGRDDLSDTWLLSDDPVFPLACSDQHHACPVRPQLVFWPASETGYFVRRRRQVRLLWASVWSVSDKGRSAVSGTFAHLFWVSQYLARITFRECLIPPEWCNRLLLADDAAP